MAFRNTNSAEQWDLIYKAFDQVNFTSFDFDTIKASLVDYLRTYYAETFNDLIQSSEMIALLELFAYVAEQLAYRLDMVAHENFITTAQRKQSILRLAKLISYKATRNIPVRGLVKFTSVTTTERVIDSRGVNLSGLTIVWNDPNNANWREQFTLVMNRVLSTRFGQPQKTYQVGDVVMDLYALTADPASLPNGVFPYTAATGLDSFPMELVPADLDADGPFEREPDLDAAMTILYGNDGIGDGSDYTGFLAYTKQGVLTRIDLTIPDPIPNNRLEFIPNNVNHTDVWVQQVDDQGAVTQRWKQVETVAEQNLVFNDDRTTRLKYEVDTLENDQVAVVFGDGDFSEAPQGLFRFWMRQSANRAVVIQKNRVVNESFAFTYTASTGATETCALTFSLTTTLQNGAGSETIEHIRQAAPATYYAQNRMVNGQDYNTFMLRDPTILRLKTINRTFAGQPKYIDWNDASGSYENVKLFGDDLVMRYTPGLNSLTSSASGQALIDDVLEPLLSQPGLVNASLHLSASDPVTAGVVSPPRRAFIEDARPGLRFQADGSWVRLIDGTTPDGSLKEKTALQALIDRHWYGEPLAYVEGSDGKVWAQIPDPDTNPKDDSRIYAEKVPRTVDGVNKYPPGDVGSGLQPIAEQDYFALRYNRYMRGVGDGAIAVHNPVPASPGGQNVPGEVWTIEVSADGTSLAVRSNKRGSFPAGQVADDYYIAPAGFSTPVLFFTVAQGVTPFEPGDAFVLDVPSPTGAPVARTDATPGYEPYGATGVLNLSGWWELLSYSQLPHFVGGEVAAGDELLYTPLDPAAPAPYAKQYSWLIFVRKVRQQPTNVVIGYEVHYRDLALTVRSDTTKFWFNEADQLLDSETLKRVFDNVKVLRSNLDSAGAPLGASQSYDVVGPVRDSDGVVDFHELQVAPTDLMQEDASGDLVPDRLLQFETFSAGSYEFFALSDPSTTLDPAAITVSGGGSTLVTDGETVVFQPAATAGTVTASPTASRVGQLLYGRRQRMPALGAGDAGLDFMWQHFAPYTNIIDPSVTNIHDAYVLTQGYYDSVVSYLRGLSTAAPTPPTPLDLRNSYAYLLKNKMLSDTVVFHPGKMRLLFGPLAEPQLRASFKVVRSPAGVLTNERVRQEVLAVIEDFFDIANWDFGQTFYATELISRIHQHLPTEVASVVLVPTFSTNSFGDLFTVTAGIDQILHGAATPADIVIVDALTPTVLRQTR